MVNGTTLDKYSFTVETTNQEQNRKIIKTTCSVFHFIIVNIHFWQTGEVLSHYRFVVSSAIYLSCTVLLSHLESLE
jgi:hypothetical protein